MAEISVERQSGFPLWAGILGLIALAAILWMLFSLGNVETNYAAADLNEPDVAVVNDSARDVAE